MYQQDSENEIDSQAANIERVIALGTTVEDELKKGTTDYSTNRNLSISILAVAL